MASNTPNPASQQYAAPATAAASQLSELPEATSSLLAKAVAVPNPVGANKVDLYLKKTQDGGSVEDIINRIDVDTNKFLRSDDNRIIFEFVENTNIEYFTNKKIFARGALTAVYKIKGSDGIIYILRAMDPSEFYIFTERHDHKKSMDESITKFIGKYEEDRRLFGHHMIEIFHYGTIFSGATPVCPYVITKVYKNSSDILQLPLPLKVEFVKQLLTFNFNLDQNRYVCRDLKLVNIGYELLPTGEIKFIILDYDMVTLVKKSDYSISHNYVDPRTRILYRLYGLPGLLGPSYLIHGRLPYGTFPPPYLLDYFSPDKQDEIVKRLDKISSGGIVDVLSSVFGLVPPSTLLSYQTNIIRYFEEEKQIDPQEKQRLHNIIIKCPTRDFSDLQIKLKERMLIPLTNMNYDAIPTPKQTLEIFNEIISPTPPSVTASAAAIQGPSTPYMTLPTPSINMPVLNTPVLNTVLQPKDDSAKKYLKYKQKYLALKKLIKY
jgi:hypothetical protein